MECDRYVTLIFRIPLVRYPCILRCSHSLATRSISGREGALVLQG